MISDYCITELRKFLYHNETSITPMREGLGLKKLSDAESAACFFIIYMFNKEMKKYK